MLADGVAGLQWTPPSNWKNEGSRPMRAATYKVSADAECVAYYFGQGQGGSVDANVQRWKGQFQPLKSSDVKKKTVHGLPLTTLDLSGTYTGMGGPMMQSKARRSELPYAGRDRGRTAGLGLLQVHRTEQDGDGEPGRVR